MSEKSNIELSDRTYDILRTLGKDADFLYDTINKYINMLKRKIGKTWLICGKS